MCLWQWKEQYGTMDRIFPNRDAAKPIAEKKKPKVVSEERAQLKVRLVNSLLYTRAYCNNTPIHRTLWVWGRMINTVYMSRPCLRHLDERTNTPLVIYIPVVASVVLVLWT